MHRPYDPLPGAQRLETDSGGHEPVGSFWHMGICERRRLLCWHCQPRNGSDRTIGALFNTMWSLWQLLVMSGPRHPTYSPASPCSHWRRSPRSRPSPLPRLVDPSTSVGGRSSSLGSGTGSPTVILDAGYGDSGGLWAPIQNGIAPLTRVCTYDRPNVSAGASDPAPTPRIAQDHVADLHALLSAAAVPGPYVSLAPIRTAV